MPKTDTTPPAPHGKRLAKFTNESGEEFDVHEHGKTLWLFIRKGSGEKLYIHFSDMKTDAKTALAAGKDFDAREREEFKRKQALLRTDPE